MKKSNGINPWFIFAVAVVLTVSMAMPAGAKNNNRKLFGDYAANFSLNCATCSTAFAFLFGVAPYCPSDALSTTYTWNAQGVYTFDGNGTLAFVGRYLGVLSEPFSLSTTIKTNVVLPGKLKCLDGGYYTVNDDLTVEAGFESCTVYADELENYPIHVISNVNLKGRLLDRMDGPVLLLTDTMDPASPTPKANIEIVTSPTPGGPVITQRICGMTGTAIPIKGKRMKKNE
jgi:hypothetical protein